VAPGRTIVDMSADGPAQRRVRDLHVVHTPARREPPQLGVLTQRLDWLQRTIHTGDEQGPRE